MLVREYSTDGIFDYNTKTGVRRRVSQAKLDAERKAARREEQSRIRRKGHDCWENVVHGVDPKSRLRDYYTCAVCGDLLQVG